MEGEKNGFLTTVSRHKEEGNGHYRDKNYELAVKCYSLGLDSLSSISSGTSLDSEICSVRATLLCNRAACYLPLSRADLCIADCSACLSIDSSRLKAYFRRAQAYESVKDLTNAVIDLRLALKLQPTNADALSQLQRIQRSITSTKSHSIIDEIGLHLSGLGADEVSGIEQDLRLLMGQLSDLDVEAAMEIARRNIVGILVQYTRHHVPVISSLSLHVLTSCCSHRQFVTAIYSLASTPDPLELNLCWPEFRSRSHEFCNDFLCLLLRVMIHFPLNDNKQAQLRNSFERQETEHKANKQYSKPDMQIPHIPLFMLTNIVNFLEVGLPIAPVTASSIISVLLSDAEGYGMGNDDSKGDNEENVMPRIQAMKNRAKFERKDNIVARSKYHAVFISSTIPCVLVDLCEAGDSSSSACLSLILKTLDNDACMKVCHELSSGSFVRFLHILLSLVIVQPDDAIKLIDSFHSQHIGNLQRYLLDHDDNPTISHLICQLLSLLSSSTSGRTWITSSLSHYNELVDGLANSSDEICRSYGHSLKTKLSVASPSISSLSSCSEVIRNPVLVAAMESSLETMTYLTTTMTAAKNSIVFGSSDCVSCSKQIFSMSSPSVYSLVQLCYNLTVTREAMLKLEVESKSEMTYDQYKQLSKLQKPKTDNDKESEDKEEPVDDQCDNRITACVRDGIISCLDSMSSSSTLTSKTAEILSSCWVNIACVISVRGQLVANGGLSSCVKLYRSNEKETTIRTNSSHALSKMLISVNPLLMTDSQRYDVVQPLLCLTRSVTASNLQQFESLLALTNISSYRQDHTLVQHMVHERILTSVYYHVFSENEMVQMAAVECLCNLAHLEEFSSWVIAAASNPSADPAKLFLCLAADFDNVDKSKAFEIARACIGILAIACQAHEAICRHINDNHVELSSSMLSSLVSSGHEELMHRSLVCLCTIIDSCTTASPVVTPQFKLVLQALSLMTDQIKSQDVKSLIAEVAGKFVPL